MSETLHPGELSSVIASILNSKDWYQYDSNGDFNWESSIDSLSKRISQIVTISTKKLTELIETSFDEKALTETNNGEKLIDQLLEIDPQLIIWTEGDRKWQDTKIKNTGINEKIKNIFCHTHKLEILEKIISLIDESKTNVLIVIDDKNNNLKTIKELNKKFKNIKIIAYQLDLDSKKQSPDSCLAFIQKKSKKGNVRIISDFDRVLIDPKKVFTKIVARKIAEEIISSQ